MKMILCDAQTSGGLLMSVHPADVDKLLDQLHEANIKDAQMIGSMSKKGKGMIKVGRKK
jgi:selenide,water dikinase